MGKVLVCYFSHTGNTEAFAKNILAKLQADGRDVEEFRIEPINAYPEGRDDCLPKAMEERTMGERPEYIGDVDVSKYDTIFFGYPIWCGDLPMIVYNFLESHTFEGIKFYPFLTHGGSGENNTFMTVGNLAVGAIRKDGLSMPGTLAPQEGGKKQAEYFAGQAEI